MNGGRLDVGNAEVKLEEENRSLKADVKKLKDDLASTKQSEGCLPVLSPSPRSRGSLSTAALLVLKY